MNKEVQLLIEKLDLQPHPEGGFFKETYRSLASFDPGSPYRGERNHSTCIYFLLTSESFSAFHKIHQDEIWHFYNGSPITLHTISPAGSYQSVKIGSDLEQGEIPQYIVPQGHWFAAEVLSSDSYALVGCTVAPGFDFEDFEMAVQKDLVALCPQQKDLICRLTR